MPSAPSLLILGADTVMAAVPATAVQLTHACTAAGYEAVIPASWGDELVAGRVLERVSRSTGPVVQCSCPRVSDRLQPTGDAIASLLVCTVPPVVAAAEYLRALYAPVRPSITFAGGCGAGASDVIDTWVTPHELLATLAERGISLGDQPTEFDTLPPDRRRFHSEPGGLPARSALRHLAPPVQCVEVHSTDIVTAVGQHLLSDERVLVDVAVALGCHCAGAGTGASVEAARARVREHEPPRAPSPVVDHRVPVVLDAEFPRAAIPVTAVMASPPAETAAAKAGGAQLQRTSGTLTEPPAEPSRRRSPAGLPRPVLGSAPRTSRADGRPLPRAYVARRRSSPRGTPQVPPRASGPSPAARRERLLWIGAGTIAGVALAALAALMF